MNCVIKIKIFNNNECLMGPGIATLLEKTEELGSVTAAAHYMELSTTKAWKIIRKTEKANGRQLINTKTGGSGGGSTTLTDYARHVISEFRKIESNCQKIADSDVLKSDWNSYNP